MILTSVWTSSALYGVLCLVIVAVVFSFLARLCLRTIPTVYVSFRPIGIVLSHVSLNTRTLEFLQSIYDDYFPLDLTDINITKLVISIVSYNRTFLLYRLTLLTLHTIYYIGILRKVSQDSTDNGIACYIM
jgi:hypothetical protein